MCDDFGDSGGFDDYGDATGFYHGQSSFNLRFLWHSTFAVAFMAVAATIISAVCLWNSCIDLLVLTQGETTVIPVTRVVRNYGRNQHNDYFYYFPGSQLGKSNYLFSGIDDRSRDDGKTAITPWVTPNRRGKALAFKVAYLPDNRANYFIMEDSSVLIRWIVSILGAIICPLLILRFNHLAAGRP